MEIRCSPTSGRISLSKERHDDMAVVCHCHELSQLSAATVTADLTRHEKLNNSSPLPSGVAHCFPASVRCFGAASVAQRCSTTGGRAQHWTSQRDDESGSSV